MNSLSSLTTVQQPSPGIRALFAGLAYAYGTDGEGRPFYDMEEVQRAAFEAEVNLWHEWMGRTPPAVTMDTGNTHQLWLFSFGAHGDHDVYVWSDGDICDALEAAAETLGKGFFTEPDYAEAANEVGCLIDEADEEKQEEIREHAETDLTYTESGFIASWEWWGTEITPEEALDRMWDGR